MVKSIIKEIIIVLLLLIAIILALGVLFYEYIPSNKTVPSVATYTTSQSVKDELNEQVTEDETVLVTYEITESDLKTYEKTKEYVQGRRNPFAATEDTTSQNATSGNTSSGSQTTGNTNSSSSSSSENTNTNSTNNSPTTNTNDDDGNFFPDKGTK